jgi:purine-nucleoside phosphorylase
LSEVQLPIRSLAEWGVRRLVVTTAAGAVDEELAAGDVVVVESVLDLQHPGEDGQVEALGGTPSFLTRAVTDVIDTGSGFRSGTHACVPGPQYETRAELAVLRCMGAATVSMSGAAEVRAAREKGREVVVLAVVTNSGDTTHSEVLAAAPRGLGGVLAVLRALSEVWE